MPKQARTPHRPSRSPRSDGLLVQLASGGSKAKSLARLEQAVAETLPGQWHVELVHHGARQYEVLRTKPGTQPTMRQAFEFARDLEAHAAVAECEVAAFLPGADPERAQYLSTAEQKAQPKSSGGDDDAPCSRFEEWALVNVRVQAAWAQPVPEGGKALGEGIVVAHPDTGYTRHPEFFQGGRILTSRGYDFEDDRADPKDPLVGSTPGHGTATGSVILSGIGDQSGELDGFVSGVAPKARLIPIRVSSGVVHLSFRRVVKAIYHAIEERAHVISMSLGGPFQSNALDRAIDAALDRGIVVIAAAGNKWPFVVYPAKCDGVVAVAATDCSDRPWRSSARGRDVDFAAPGESVWRAAAKKGQPTRFWNGRSSGTSYATAMTAGACSLWLAFHGRSKLIERYGKENLGAAFRFVARSTTQTPPGWKKKKFGTGILDVDALLRAPLPPKSQVVSAAGGKSGADSSREMAALLPEVTRSQSRAMLAKTLGCRPADLGDTLAEFGQELRYWLVQNPDLRAAFISRAKAKSVVGLSAKVLARKHLLGGRASRSLAERLGI